MEKEITINGQKISCVLRSSAKLRSVKIKVNPGGFVTVAYPVGFDIGEVEKLLERESDWLARKISFFKRVIPIKRDERGDYKKWKEKTFEFVKKEIERINGAYRFKIGKISVKNQSSRWGSCSRKGNLNFNYRLIFLPDAISEYVIIHELCHLAEMNHGKKFWELVSKTIPDYKKRRKELRMVGTTINP